MHEPGYSNILVGGFDEMTGNQLIFYNRLNYYKTQIDRNLTLLDHKDSGTISGEGTAFFVLSHERTTNTYAVMNDVDSFNYPTNNEFVLNRIQEFLDKNHLNVSDIDVLLCGLNGDFNLDKIYTEVIGHLFMETAVGYFKHLCGEYHTASAFALWLASNILKHQVIPEVIRYNKVKVNNVKTILIYNHYRNTNHSLILLSAK